MLFKHLENLKNEPNSREKLLEYISDEIQLREDSNDKICMMLKNFYKLIENKKIE